MTVRTRFAPSPTGFLHVGGIRTALFAWLIAKKAGGQFILRIEDTDRARLVAGAERHIQDSLKALGLDWDEGPINQSDRLNVYIEWANKLIASGRAYADPYTAEQVQTFRDEAQKEKRPFLYRNHRPENPPAWDGIQPLRFKSDPKSYKWHDEVMGELSTGPEVIDDFILLKSGDINFPTYNFAHIVDDAEMEITHVIRGQEFLASMPNYLNLYEALGLERPIFATMPHILAPEGNKKLSKRDGAKDVLDYIRDGYLPDALVNFIASLGWNDGTEQEIFSREELIKKFSLDHVQRSGARFDEKRLDWMNGHYIRELPFNKLFDAAVGFWPPEADGEDVSPEYLKRVLALVQERLKKLSELPELTSFFFIEPDPAKAIGLYEQPVDKQLKNISAAEVKQFLATAMEELEKTNFSEEEITNSLNGLLEKLGVKPGVLFAIIRIAVTSSASSPQLFGTLATLGKYKTMDRIHAVLDRLS